MRSTRFEFWAVHAGSMAVAILLRKIVIRVSQSYEQIIDLLVDLLARI